MITPGEFLKLIDKEEKDIFKIGTVGELSGVKAHIKFDGELEQSNKGYLSVSYAPVVNDRVLLVKVKGTYLILGKIIQ